jgi:hypothetical protein
VIPVQASCFQTTTCAPDFYETLITDPAAMRGKR